MRCSRCGYGVRSSIWSVWSVGVAGAVWGAGGVGDHLLWVMASLTDSGMGRAHPQRTSDLEAVASPANPLGCATVRAFCRAARPRCVTTQNGFACGRIHRATADVPKSLDAALAKIACHRSARWQRESRGAARISEYLARSRAALLPTPVLRLAGPKTMGSGWIVRLALLRGSAAAVRRSRFSSGRLPCR